MANVPSKCMRARIGSAIEGLERLAVQMSFIASIASPLHLVCTPELKAELLKELDERRVNYYHGLHMRIIHAWLRFISDAKRTRFWRILEEDPGTSP